MLVRDLHRLHAPAGAGSPADLSYTETEVVMADSVLLAVVVLFGSLACVNLVFTLGVIRRLREHTAELAALTSGAAVDMDVTPKAGSAIPEFAVTTTDGRQLSDLDLSGGPAYLGYFTPNCPPCRDRLPEFLRLAGEVKADHFVVVVGADSLEAGLKLVGDVGGEVGGDVRLVVEKPDGPLMSAFGISRTPTLLALDNGTVKVNAATIGQLTVPEPA